MTTDNTQDEVKTSDTSTSTSEWGNSGSYKIPSSREELRVFLNGAMSLELSTLPLYLQAWFSLNTSTTSGQVEQVKAASDLMHTVIIEEMLHMNIVSNLILSIFGDEKAPVVTKYNINYEKYGLPQNIRPDLGPLTLNRYSQAQLFTFSQVECETVLGTNDNKYPYLPGDKTYADVYFDRKSPENTIGEFYSALGKGLQALSSGDKPQITFGNTDRQFFDKFYKISFPEAPEILGENPPKIDSYEFAAKLIKGIVEQGEAFDIPMLLIKKLTYMKQDENTKKWTKIISNNTVEQSHFLKFVELLTGYEIISTEPMLKQCTDTQFCIRFNYDIDGAKYKFNLDDTNLFKQEGSPQNTDLNSVFETLLSNLQDGLNNNNMKDAGQSMHDLQPAFNNSLPKYSNWQNSYPDPTNVPLITNSN